MNVRTLPAPLSIQAVLASISSPAWYTYRPEHFPCFLIRRREGNLVYQIDHQAVSALPGLLSIPRPLFPGESVRACWGGATAFGHRRDLSFRMHNDQLVNRTSVSLPSEIPCNSPVNPCDTDTASHPAGWLRWLMKILKTCPILLEERHESAWLVLFASVPVTTFVAALMVRCIQSCLLPDAVSMDMSTMLASKLFATAWLMQGLHPERHSTSLDHVRMLMVVAC